MKAIASRFVLSYLRILARMAISIHKPRIIGITGSVGKSSTRNLIYATIKDYASTTVIDKGNSETGLPLGVLGLSPRDYSVTDWIRMVIAAPFGLTHLAGQKYLVAEMGVDDPYPPKNMRYLLSIIDPYIAVFTNVFAVHSMQFDKVVDPSLIDPQRRAVEIQRAIAQEKGRIITDSHCRFAIYNADNPYVKDVVDSFKTDRQVNRYSFGDQSRDTISYGSYAVSSTGTKFELIKGKQRVHVNLNGMVLPEEYREIIAASLLCGLAIGMTLQDAASALERNFSMPKGRASVFEGIRDTLIIDSSYNASKASVLAFLDLAARLGRTEKRSVCFIMGDMRELGEESESEHQAVAEKIRHVVDQLYLVGPLTRQYIVPNLKSVIKDMKHFPNAKAAGEYVRNHVKERAIILVKGSQNTIFLEEAVKQLLLNAGDEENLCRQEEFWMRMKKDM